MCVRVCVFFSSFNCVDADAGFVQAARVAHCCVMTGGGAFASRNEQVANEDSFEAGTVSKPE